MLFHPIPQSAHRPPYEQLLDAVHVPPTSQWLSDVHCLHEPLTQYGLPVLVPIPHTFPHVPQLFVFVFLSTPAPLQQRLIFEGMMLGGDCGAAL